VRDRDGFDEFYHGTRARLLAESLGERVLSLATFAAGSGRHLAARMVPAIAACATGGPVDFCYLDDGVAAAGEAGARNRLTVWSCQSWVKPRPAEDPASVYDVGRTRSRRSQDPGFRVRRLALAMT
jgi:hypothetical protein